MRIAIASSLVDRIVGDAAADPGREVCGILFGGAGVIAEARAALNVAEQPHDSFEIDPQALFAAIRAERVGGPKVIGNYHSHPRGSARPSPRDAAAARAGDLWLIVAGGEARLWRACPGGRFVPVALDVLPASPGCISGT